MAASFWKVLTKTDVEKRLTVPTEYFERHISPRFGLGKTEIEMEVEDGTGQVWVLGCSVRRSGLYAKPVISRGWCSFVRGKALRAGDVIRFSLQLHSSSKLPRTRLNFRVAATRGIKLLGSRMDVPIL